MSHSSAHLPRLPLVRLATRLTRLNLYNSQTKVANKEVRPECMVKGTKQSGNTLDDVKREWMDLGPNKIVARSKCVCGCLII